jgi:hypothetical protein
MTRIKKVNIQIDKSIYLEIERLSRDCHIIKIANDLAPILSSEKIDLENYFSNENIVIALVVDYFGRGGDTTRTNFVIKEAVKLAVENINY